MTFEPPQMGLPPHVVKHILASPSRWYAGGDLLKKQLKKLTTNEAAISRFMANALTGHAYFPVLSPGGEPRLDISKYPKQHTTYHVTENVYALMVI